MQLSLHIHPFSCKSLGRWELNIANGLMSSSTHNAVLLFLQSEPQGPGRGLMFLDGNITSENWREDALE